MIELLPDVREDSSSDPDKIEHIIRDVKLDTASSLAVGIQLITLHEEHLAEESKKPHLLASLLYSSH